MEIIRDYSVDLINSGVVSNEAKNRIPSCINEEGLIELLSRSKSPIAKEFRKFVYQLLKNLRLGRIQILD